MDFVRRYYGVPAKRGGRVAYRSEQPNAKERIGIITRATHYVYVRFDGERWSRPYHPTDPGLTYLTPHPDTPR